MPKLISRIVKMGAMMGGSKSTTLEHSCRITDSCQPWVLSLGSYLVCSVCLLARVIDTERLLGSVNIMRYGAGPNGVMRTLGQYMMGSGATFGLVSYLSISISISNLL